MLDYIHLRRFQVKFFHTIQIAAMCLIAAIVMVIGADVVAAILATAANIVLN